MKRDYSNKSGNKFYDEILNDPAKLPIKFVYDDTAYKGLYKKFFTLISKITNKEGKKETSDLVFDFLGELEVTLKITHYYSHGVTEWTVFFKNVSASNSKILENVFTEIDFIGSYPTVKGILGDHINQYRPYSFDPTNNVLEFSSITGQTSHNNFPYFNIEYGTGGAMLAIGWAGTWNARFFSNGNKTTYTANAVNGMKLYLKPDEEIRTALFVLAPYTVRNEHYATNYWRDWFVKYNLPKNDKDGNNVKPFSTISLALDTGRPNSDGSISETHETYKPSLDKLKENGLKFDFWWLDAGWYVAPDGNSAIPFSKGRDWWDTVGTWEPDHEKWPDKTLLEATDYVRANGMRTLLWFEPERVLKNFIA